MVNTSIHLPFKYCHNCLPLVSIYGGMEQLQFHLNNSQEGGIVTFAFHLCQCMVEWHESQSTYAIKKVASSYSFPLQPIYSGMA
jgi:hypothetical protein